MLCGSVEKFSLFSVTKQFSRLSIHCRMSLDVDRCVGASIENVFDKYIFLHLLASPGPSGSAQRADTMLTIL